MNIDWCRQIDVRMSEEQFVCKIWINILSSSIAESLDSVSRRPRTPHLVLTSESSIELVVGWRLRLRGVRAGEAPPTGVLKWFSSNVNASSDLSTSFSLPSVWSLSFLLSVDSTIVRASFSIWCNAISIEFRIISSVFPIGASVVALLSLFSSTDWSSWFSSIGSALVSSRSVSASFWSWSSIEGVLFWLAPASLSHSWASLFCFNRPLAHTTSSSSWLFLISQSVSLKLFGPFCSCTLSLSDST